MVTFLGEFLQANHKLLVVSLGVLSLDAFPDCLSGGTFALVQSEDCILHHHDVACFGHVEILSVVCSLGR